MMSPSEITATPTGSLWRHSDFRLLWSAQAISAFGSRITREGLPLTAVLVLGAGATEVGVLAALTTAPALLVGLLVGGWIDRSRKRSALIFADLARALLLASIPAAALAGVLGIVQLWIVAAGMGALTTLFEMADNAYLPTILSRDQLVEGNSKLSATDAVAETGGPAIAGFLVQALTAPVAILLDALSYAGSALLLMRIRACEPQHPPPVTRPTLLSDLRAGLRASFGHPVARPLTLQVATATLFGSFFLAVYVVHAVRTLGLTPAMLGVTIAMGGVGAFLGSLLAGRAASWFGVGPTIVGSALVAAGAQVMIPLAGGSPERAMGMLVVAQILGDGAGVIALIHATSLRQAVLPQAVLGRAEGMLKVLTGTLAPLGALIAGALATGAGTRTVTMVAVAGLMAAPLWVLFSPVKGLRHAPAEGPDS